MLDKRNEIPYSKKWDEGLHSERRENKEKFNSVKE